MCVTLVIYQENASVSSDKNNLHTFCKFLSNMNFSFINNFHAGNFYGTLNFMTAKILCTPVIFMFFIKFPLSPEIPLTAVCWLCVTSRMAWRPCRVKPDTRRQQSTATFKENVTLFDKNLILIRNWILQSQFHRSLESFMYKKKSKFALFT